MTLIYEMFRIKLKVIKHSFNDILIRFPFLIVIFIMLLAGFIGGSIFCFRAFDKTFNDSLKNMVITNMLLEKVFVNVNNIIMFVILVVVILRNMNLKTDDLPEAILINDYKPNEIKKAYNYASNIILFLILIVFTTPILFRFILLFHTSMLNRIVILIIQSLYFLFAILMALNIVTLLKYILVYILKIKKELVIHEIIAVVSLIVLSLTLWASIYTGFKNYLPSACILNLAAAMAAGNTSDIAINIGINLINIYAMYILYKIISRNFEIDTASEIQKTSKTIIRMDNEFINVYLNVIIKMLLRNIEGLISLISILAFTIMIALGLHNAGMTYKYSTMFFYLVTFVIILGTVTFIQDFNDFEIIETIDTYGGNLKEFNFILVAFYSLLLFIIFTIFILIIYKSFGLPIMNLDQSPVINITLYVTIAVLTKTLLLKKDSSLLIQMISTTAYGLIYSGVQIIIMNILPCIDFSKINISSIASYYMLVLLFSALLYLIQYEILIYKKNYN